ncbi:MAG: DUF4097 family beta strand repeat-containing protein, partial [Balneolaceae bacterium]|nr:DUF4097 family beta strand repeat-containing protein [Balneolaceae bacterium]
TRQVRVAPSVPQPLPPTIVIDLENLESLKNLENLKNLQNLRSLEQLEAKLQNLDQILKLEEIGETTALGVEEIRKKLQEIEKADYTVQLQNKKLIINKKYDVKEASWVETSPGVYVYRESFDASKLKSLNLDMGFGNINLVGTSEEDGEIVVQATGKLQTAEAMKKMIHLKFLIRDDGAHFDVRPSDNRSVSDQLNLEATLTLPTKIGVSASTSGGHISADNLEGAHQLKTSGGHIVLNNMSGDVEAHTSGGHITCDNLKGTIGLKTQGGHIKIQNLVGELSARTGGGHIEVSGLEGRGNVSTSGGNISTQVATLNGPLMLDTSAGNINLQLPPGLQADLSASGSKVILSEIFKFSGTQSDGRLQGTLNGGGVSVNAECDFGNVVIQSND